MYVRLIDRAKMAKGAKRAILALFPVGTTVVTFMKHDLHQSRMGAFSALIDLFSLYVLLPHFRPRDGTLENHCFQILKYLRAYE